MSATNFTPSIKDILDIDLIPGNIDFIDNLAGDLVEKIYYNDLIQSNSRERDFAFYKLTLVIYQGISLTIPGTGITFQINKNASANNVSNVPVSLQYRWEILKYIDGLLLSNFAEGGSSFFNLLKDILGINELALINKALSSFVSGDAPISEFVNLYNEKYLIDLQYSENADHYSEIENIVEQLQDSGINIYDTLYDNFIKSPSVEDTLDNIKILFNEIVGDVDFDTLIKRLFIPKFNISFEDLTLSLVIPAERARKVDPLTYLPLVDPITQKDVDASVDLDVDALTFDSQTGMTFSGENNISFPMAEITGTGFILDVQDVKLDLSTTSNIAEADKDGRSSDFVGVYIGDATILFPADWGHNDGNSNGVIKARNLLIGTGGITGALRLEAKNGTDPSPIVEVNFGGFKINLTSFELIFKQSAIISSTIKGLLTIPNFKDSLGNPAEIEIDIHIDEDGDFKITAREDQGINAISIPDVLDLVIHSLSIGKEDNKYYVSTSGSINFTANTGGVDDGNGGSLLPSNLPIEELIIWEDGKMEIKGGGIVLPKPFRLNLGPVQLSVSAIHFGSHEQMYTESVCLVLK